jgi:hypothetical protein
MIHPTPRTVKNVTYWVCHPDGHAGGHATLESAKDHARQVRANGGSCTIERETRTERVSWAYKQVAF